MNDVNIDIIFKKLLEKDLNLVESNFLVKKSLAVISIAINYLVIDFTFQKKSVLKKFLHFLNILNLDVKKLM